MQGTLLFAMILLVVLATVGVVMVLVVWKRRNTEKIKETNFRNFYVMGIIFIPAGIGTMIVYSRMGLPFFIGVPLISMGLTYLIVGLKNKDKWR